MKNVKIKKNKLTVCSTSFMHFKPLASGGKKSTIIPVSNDKEVYIDIKLGSIHNIIVKVEKIFITKKSSINADDLESLKDNTFLTIKKGKSIKLHAIVSEDVIKMDFPSTTLEEEANGFAGEGEHADICLTIK